MPFNVYITRPIPEAGVRILQSACDPVDVGPEDRIPTRDEMLEAVRGRDAVLCNVGDTMDAGVIEAAAPTCKVLANYGVGVNHIDLRAAERVGIIVTNTPGVLTDATADLTWTLILAVARRIREGMELVASGRWTGWAPTQMLGSDVSGRTLGIIGAGRIGTAVGLRAAGFRMRVFYVDPRPNDELDRIGAERVALEPCLAASHFVTLHVPLTPETRHLISQRQFAAMRRDAILINTSRGEVVEEAILVDALEEGRLAGAGLDVFENEPNPSPELLDMPNVVCLPHLGSATVATRSQMAEMAAKDLLRVLNGEPPEHPVGSGG